MAIENGKKLDIRVLVVGLFRVFQIQNYADAVLVVVTDNAVVCVCSIGLQVCLPENLGPCLF